LKVYSIVSGSALIATALLTCSLIYPPKTISAEALPAQSRQQTTPEIPSKGNLGEKLAVEEVYVVPPTNYVATAYSLRGRTASGRPVAKGLIAADPRHLPLGSRVRLQAGAYSGEYLVADTGSLVRGRRIDIWTPTSREAMRFGRRTVKLTVLSLGGRRAANSR
jgi:3D (Asp-Asp-Asp) domain-containing protein